MFSNGPFLSMSQRIGTMNDVAGPEFLGIPLAPVDRKQIGTLQELGAILPGVGLRLSR